jgi:hypothetical protein
VLVGVDGATGGTGKADVVVAVVLVVVVVEDVVVGDVVVGDVERFDGLIVDGVPPPPLLASTRSP